ncbi:MAG: glycosyltransferase family 1 protein [Pseudomonadota bacterium]
MNPRLAIDMRYAAGPLSGFGRFAWNLIEGLVEIGPPAPLLLVRRPAQTIPEALAPATGLHWQIVDRAPYEPIGQLRLSRALAARGIEVLVSPDCFAPLMGSLKQVITVHDIIPLRCPDLLPRSAKGRFSPIWRQWLRLQVGMADQVLTVSDHAKRDIADMFPNAGSKLATVNNSVPTPPTVPPPSQRRPASGLLYVGRDAPYKNIVGCVETVAALRRWGIDVGLTIVGEPDPRYPGVGQAIQRLGLQEHVTITGHVDDETLARHYREASVFLFLSRYEGFGLPPLEAMARGVPVVASDRTSMPEVLGEAALLVDPDDGEAAAKAVRRILEDPSLFDDLRTRGLERASMFTKRRQAAMFWDAVSSML